LIAVAKTNPPPKKDKPEIIGYAVRPMPKRRRRLRDFRENGADYIRRVFAYGREMKLSAKIGCCTALVAAVLLITLILLLVASPQ
jgi:hypothetical protein